MEICESDKRLFPLTKPVFLSVGATESHKLGLRSRTNPSSALVYCTQAFTPASTSTAQTQDAPILLIRTFLLRVHSGLLQIPHDIQTGQLAPRAAQKSWLGTYHERCEQLLLGLCRVANQRGLLATRLPSYRHTWFQLGVCTYKQLAMAVLWSGSAVLTASQGRHKLLMKDIYSHSLAVNSRFGLEASRVLQGKKRSDSESSQSSKSKRSANLSRG